MSEARDPLVLACPSQYRVSIKAKKNATGRGSPLRELRGLYDCLHPWPTSWSHRQIRVRSCQVASSSFATMALGCMFATVYADSHYMTLSHLHANAPQRYYGPETQHTTHPFRLTPKVIYSHHEVMIHVCWCCWCC